MTRLGAWLAAIEAMAALMLAAVAAPALAQNDDIRLHYPQQLSMSPKGVNIQTGKFTYAKADLEIGPLKFTRSWGDVPNFHISTHVFGTHMTYDGKKGGWSHSFGSAAWSTSEGSASYVYFYVDGKTLKFYINSSGVIAAFSKAAVGASFDSNVLTDQSGNRYTFTGFNSTTSTPAPLSHVDYADGSALDYTYNASQQVRTVVSNRGYAIVIDYDANQNISAVCGYNTAQVYVSSSTTCSGATLKTTYGYDATGSFLTSVTNAAGEVVTISGSYIYGGNQVIGPTCISLPNSSTCEIRNYYQNQPDGVGTNCCQKPYEVGEQISANGAKWFYNYDPPEDPRAVPLTPGRPAWSNSDGSGPQSWSYTASFDRGAIVDVSDPSGTFNYKYLNAAGGELIQYDLHDTSPALVTFPDGHREYFTHDLRGNVTYHFIWPKGSTEPDSLISSDPDLARCCIPPTAPTTTSAIFTAATYPTDYYKSGTAYPSGCGQGLADAKLCSSPTQIFDYKGNETDFTYDPAHGGILTKTLPAVLVNGAGSPIRPQVRYEYAQRYAWIKTSGGGYAQAATPVWLKVRERACRTTAASGQTCAGGAADEVVTDYDYGPDSGPNNLLLRGVAVTADSKTLRSCYAYDANGRKISETKPNANLTVCP